MSVIEPLGGGLRKVRSLFLELYLGRKATHEESARLSLMKLPIKMFYGLEFLGIALAGATTLPPIAEEKSKSYTHFGFQGDASSGLDVLFANGVFLLKEALEYSKSQQFIDDLAILHR